MKFKMASVFLAIVVASGFCPQTVKALTRAECIAQANSDFIECLQEAGIAAAATAIIGCVAGGLVGGAPTGGAAAVPGCIINGVVWGGGTGLTLALLCGLKYANDLNACPNE